MKEATGELNMTVVTVVAIAAVAAFFYAFVWPTVRDNIINSTKCSNAICSTCTSDGKKTVCSDCTNPADGSTITGNCIYSGDDGKGKGTSGGGTTGGAIILINK